jgi:hypothetical protein
MFVQTHKNTRSDPCVFVSLAVNLDVMYFAIVLQLAIVDYRIGPIPSKPTHAGLVSHSQGGRSRAWKQTSPARAMEYIINASHSLRNQTVGTECDLQIQLLLTSNSTRHYLYLYAAHSFAVLPWIIIVYID